MYEYKARCVEVVDGDTQDVVVDLGFHMQRQIRLRLMDVDTHETYGVKHSSEEYRRGKRETEFVREWLPNGEWPLLVRTDKRGKYGRYLAEIERRSDGEILNDRLLSEFDGVAVE
jgi:micrococcal nuclease